MNFGSMLEGNEFRAAEHRWAYETVDTTQSIVAGDAEKIDLEILERIGEEILLVSKHAGNLLATIQRAIDAGGHIFEISSALRLNAIMSEKSRISLLHQTSTETLTKQITLHQTAQTRAYQSASTLSPDLQKVCERAAEMLREFSQTSALAATIETESWSEMVTILENMQRMDAKTFDQAKPEKLMDIFDGVRLLLRSRGAQATEHEESLGLPQCKCTYGSIEDQGNMNAIEQILRATGQEHLCGSELVKLSKRKYLLYRAQLENMLAGCAIIDLDRSKAGFVIDAFGIQPLMKGQGIDEQLLRSVMEKLLVQKRDFIRIIINEKDSDLREVLKKLNFTHTDYLRNHFPAGEDGYEMEYWRPDALKCERTSREIDSYDDENDNRWP